MFNNFENYMLGVLNMNNDSLEVMVKNLTDKLFRLKNRPNLTEISMVDLKKLVPGRFYLIHYNYNGNKIWCPILALEYKVIKNKNILYAVNLEYLSPRYKIKLFSLMFNRINKMMEVISESKMVINERPMPITFENMYNILKNHKMNYAVTAYDILKIKSSYLCSVKISPEILMADCKRYNSASMKELFEKLPSDEFKDKLGDLIEEFDKLIEQYDTDSLEYHKKFSAIEKNLKLF